jgi:hypothetical protein
MPGKSRLLQDYSDFDRGFANIAHLTKVFAEDGFNDCMLPAVVTGKPDELMTYPPFPDVPQRTCPLFFNVSV